MRRRIVAAALLLTAWPAGAAVTSAEILAASADPECFEYRPVGGCLWMTCWPAGCTTATSVKYRHFTPELTVAAYGSRVAHPWREAGLAAKAWRTDGGVAARGTGTRGAANLRFKMAEALGSPGLAWVRGLRMATPVCRSGAVPMVPYYVSGADPVWRWDVVQIPWTVANLGRRLVEHGGRLWGPVYPRSGAVVQTDDFLAGAVAAQRAADVVTRRAQWQHVYRRVPEPAGTGQWGPPAVKEGEWGNHKWQEVAPARRGCEVFADRRTGIRGEGAGSRSAADGGYVFNLWRPYECCEWRGTFLIGDW